MESYIAAVAIIQGSMVCRNDKCWPDARRGSPGVWSRWSLFIKCSCRRAGGRWNLSSHEQHTHSTQWGQINQSVRPAQRDM